MIITLLAFLLVLGVLVFVHEFGHFSAARFFKVWVQKFAFGFPPKIFSKKVGETEYTVNLIPFGGYVLMYGEEGGHEKDERSFTSKKTWQKVIILAAGVFMNLVLAWVIFTAFYLFGGKSIITGMDGYKHVTNNEHVYVTAVRAESPAEQAGIKSGTMIVSVDGQIVHNNVSVANGVYEVTKNDPKKPVTISFTTDGKTYTKSIVTEQETIGGQKIQAIGITMEERGTTKSVWYLAPWYGLLTTGRIMWLTIVGLWGLLVSIFTKFQVGNAVGGPVAIYSYSGIFARMGFWALAQFIAILSISLALINILPFPALDGGHIAILVIESVRGKKISDKTKQAINNVGFGLLLLLMVGLVFRDLANLGVFEKIKGIFK